MAQMVNGQSTNGNAGVHLNRDDFQTQTCVLSFNHASEAEAACDPEVKGKEWAERYYHIITPIASKSGIMYRFDVKGFSYGMGKPLDIIFCGYSYNDGKIHQKCETDLHQLGFKMDQYFSQTRNNCLVLKFGPIKRYCNGFALYYSAHYSNVKKGLAYDKYKVIVTADDGQI